MQFSKNKLSMTVLMTPETPDEIRRFRAAKIKRDLRKNIEAQLRALQAPPSTDVFAKPSK